MITTKKENIFNVQRLDEFLLQDPSRNWIFFTEYNKLKRYIKRLDVILAINQNNIMYLQSREDYKDLEKSVDIAKEALISIDKMKIEETIPFEEKNLKDFYILIEDIKVLIGKAENLVFK